MKSTNNLLFTEQYYLRSFMPFLTSKITFLNYRFLPIYLTNELVWVDLLQKSSGKNQFNSYNQIDLINQIRVGIKIYEFSKMTL